MDKPTAIQPGEVYHLDGSESIDIYQVVEEIEAARTQSTPLGEVVLTFTELKRFMPLEQVAAMIAVRCEFVNCWNAYRSPFTVVMTTTDEDSEDVNIRLLAARCAKIAIAICDECKRVEASGK